MTLAIANGVAPLSGVTPSRGGPEAPLQPSRASAETPTATAFSPKVPRPIHRCLQRGSLRGRHGEEVDRRRPAAIGSVGTGQKA